MEVSTKRSIRTALVAAAVLAAGQSFGSPDTTIDPPFLSGKYYEQNGATSCGNNDDYCALLFSALPAGKTLTINKVSCSINSSYRPSAAYLGAYGSAAKALPTA